MAEDTLPADVATMKPPSQVVPGDEVPVKKISGADLKTVGDRLNSLFMQYVSDRRIAELRWLRNQRQYLGIYDPDIDKELNVNRSRAYPRITRVKCISVVARLMNLMFPGNERNWELTAAPSPDITVDEVKEALKAAMDKDQAAGVQTQPDINYIKTAIHQFMMDRAETMSLLIDDQLQELGGDQTLDYIALNRRAIQSGVQYGLGVLRGPYARESKSVTWGIGDDGTPKPTSRTVYKPVFEFLPIWDFYPDMSAKTFASADGYFTRQVMSRAQVRALARRPDFFEDQITDYLEANTIGNYKPQPFETELRAMGVKVNVNEMKTETTKYEIIVWHGKLDGSHLQLAGIDVPDGKLADDIDVEVWLLAGNVIKATLNPWIELEVDIKTIHTFLFDEDDTSPVGFGLPNAIRDSQMAISAATRMLMDNASVVCGPNIEINTDLMRMDQDVSDIHAYKIWLREGDGPDAQWPAVRNVEINSHLDELLKVIELFMKFADAETFVGPATGGDMSQAPSEPMRTAAGASMLRGDAALPFKDIVRSFDQFTQSIIQSLVAFNRVLNKSLAPKGDYDVIARGATSLIAKELRGMQADNLAQTLTPDEAMYINPQKLLAARVKARDMDDILLTPDELQRAQAQKAQSDQEQKQTQDQLTQANLRKLLSDAFKNVAQGQKNSAGADATTVKAAMDLLDRGLANVFGQPSKGGNGGASQAPSGQQGDTGGSGALALPAPAFGGPQGTAGPMQ